MKMETSKSNINEIFVELDELAVSVTTWANLEGVNIMVNGKDLSLRMAGALRWEDVDAIVVALTAARAA